MDSQAQSPRPGDVVGGRYRIEAPIGGGGFGTVYRAMQLNLNRAVALKVLHPGLFAAEGAHDRFIREATLAQQLKHPNTVRVFDFGSTEMGLPYIVWELMEGQPLDALIAREGRLPPARIARIVTQVLKALMEAHGLGIIHRDIKPSNLFVSNFHGEPDFVKVLDFGVAKATVDQGPAITSGALPVGTPSYMAPEQVRSETVSPATDIYAVGLVIAEMITGFPACQGRALVDIFMAQASPEPVPLAPEVLQGPFGQVVWRATQKQSSQRYATTQEMLTDIERLGLLTPSHVSSMPMTSGQAATLPAGGSGVPSQAIRTTPAVHSPYSAPPTPSLVTAIPVPTAPPPKSSSGVIWFVAGGLVVFLLLAAAVGGGAFYMMWHEDQAAAPPVVAGGGSKKLEGIGAETVRRRIEPRGWKVDGEPILNLEGSYQMNIIGINRGNQKGVVNIYDFVDAIEAEQFSAKLQKSGAAVARDRDLILEVTVTGDSTEGKKLLDLIAAQ